MKYLPAKHDVRVQSLGGDPLEKGIATHASILSWKIPWTEEPGELQFMGLQRVRHDLATKQQEQLNIILSLQKSYFLDFHVIRTPTTFIQIKPFCFLSSLNCPMLSVILFYIAD